MKQRAPHVPLTTPGLNYLLPRLFVPAAWMKSVANVLRLSPQSRDLYEGYFKCLWLINFAISHPTIVKWEKDGGRSVTRVVKERVCSYQYASISLAFHFPLIPGSSGGSGDIDLWLGNTALQWQRARITFSPRLSDSAEATPPPPSKLDRPLVFLEPPVPHRGHFTVMKCPYSDLHKPFFSINFFHNTEGIPRLVSVSHIMKERSSL